MECKVIHVSKSTPENVVNVYELLINEVLKNLMNYRHKRSMSC